MPLAIRKSNPNKPPRVLIFGSEGVGKSSFGAMSDNPVFISPEGGTDYLKNSKGEPVDEIPGLFTWSHVRGAVRDLLTEKHPYQTLVLDSADWIEKLCHAEIIGGSGKSITNCNGGYGAGYRQSEIMHKALIDDLTQLREKKNMNIIITAHAHVKQVKDPSLLEDYDSFEIKCHEFVSSLWREYVDALLFVRFRTFTKNIDSQRARAISDGSRVVYTVKQPSFQAKNRYGMKPEYDFTMGFWNTLKEFAGKPQDPREEINKLCSLVNDNTAKAVHDAVAKPDADLEAILKRLQVITKEQA